LTHALQGLCAELLCVRTFSSPLISSDQHAAVLAGPQSLLFFHASVFDEDYKPIKKNNGIYH
jgi:hypothetical protein